MNLFWDYENQKLYNKLNSGQLVQRLTLVFSDQVDVVLYIMKRNATTLLNELVDCPAGYAPLFGLKGTTLADLNGDYLAVQSVWTKTATGTYQGTIDLATTELQAEFGTATSVAVKCEFSMRDVDSKDHYSTVRNVVVDYNVNRGDEAVTHSVSLGPISLVRSEVIDGVTRTLILLADGTEVACFPPREV